MPIAVAIQEGIKGGVKHQVGLRSLLALVLATRFIVRRSGVDVRARDVCFGCGGEVHSGVGLPKGSLIDKRIALLPKPGFMRVSRLVCRRYCWRA